MKSSSSDLGPQYLPYGRQVIDEDDIAAVVAVLRSPWLTTGPTVDEFESSLAQFCGTTYAVAVSSGTAALHATMASLGIGPGDEVIVPAMTFVATANCAVFQGARPIFADVQADTLLVDPQEVEQKVTACTKAVIAVDYAGQPCDYDRLQQICVLHGMSLVADACHAIGGSYKGRAVGSLARISTFSFHPVKNMTTGEGGAVTTNDQELAARLRRFRSHGVTMDFRERLKGGTWYYEMVELGWNYRLTDVQCALGLSQLRKLPGWIERRNVIAELYSAAIKAARLDADVRPLGRACYEHRHGWHLYVVRVPPHRRAAIFTAMRKDGIGVNVHYLPVHLHPFYRQRFGTGPGLCPVAEAAYAELLSLPMFPTMTENDIARVVESLRAALGATDRA